MEPATQAAAQAGGAMELLLPAVISAGGVAFASIIAFLGWYARARVEELHRARERLGEARVELYVGILEPYMRILNAQGEKAAEAKALKQLLSHEYRLQAYQLMLMGEDEVAKGFNEFMQYSYRTAKDPDPDSLGMLDNVGDFMLVLRRGLGNRKTSLKSRDMMRWTLKDLDVMVAKAAAKQG